MKNKKEITKDIHFGYTQIQKGGDSPLKKPVYLHENSRLSNLLVMSTKNSGKSKNLIPMMFEQDIRHKDIGITVIVGTNEMAFDLYAMAKNAKRKVRILSPSTNMEIMNKLLYTKEWNYDYINDNIIDYKKSLNDRDVIIIDMEIEKYSLSGIRATALLLMQLQSDMLENKRRHYVYIDDAYRYLDFINNLLEYGDDHNIATHIFFQSRSQFKTSNRDYTALIDNNVRNIILLQGINYDDAVYYSSRMNIPKFSMPSDFTNRQYGEFVYEFLGESDFKLKKGKGVLLGLTEEKRSEIRSAAKKYRKKMSKENPQTGIDKKISMINEQSYLGQINDILLKQELDKESHLSVLADEIQEKENKEKISEIQDFKYDKKEEEKSEQENNIPEQISETPLEENHRDISRFFTPEKEDAVALIQNEKADDSLATIENLNLNKDEEFDTLGFDPSDLNLEEFEMLSTPAQNKTDNETKSNGIEITNNEDNALFEINGTIETEIMDNIVSSRPIRIINKN